MISPPLGFYVIGGDVRGDSPSYVERQADTRLYEGLIRGEFAFPATCTRAAAVDTIRT